MIYPDNFEFFGNSAKSEDFIAETGRNFLFSFVMSYTATCEIPGITFAGADKNSLKLTPAADAEYIHYGSCKIVDKIPMTPDGKPTPALLTKTALESASIPHVTIDAGTSVSPKLPYINTGLIPGKNIAVESAMPNMMVSRAVDYGRIVGRTLASITDCLVIGESIPGGTTTALATLRGLGFKARVSSSMTDNPILLKNKVANMALTRVQSDNPYEIVAKVGDPMIAFIAGMLSSASMVTKVMLAGGTQMAAVLGFASKIGFNEKNTVLGTTSYILDDQTADIQSLVSEIVDVAIISVNPGLKNSEFPGLKAYSEGFVKEGAGAGGTVISSMLKTGNTSKQFLDLVQREYRRIFT